MATSKQGSQGEIHLGVVDLSEASIVDVLERDPEMRKRIAGVFKIESSHSGPLPSPASIAAYDKHIPNGAERIMVMAEQEQLFRHKQTKSDSLEIHQFRRRGQVYALIIVMIITLFAAYLAWLGHPQISAAVMISIIVSVVSIFVIGRHGKPQADEE